MSWYQEKVWAPSPTTSRGQPTPLSADPRGGRLIYANQRSVLIRSIDDPGQTIQYTGHVGTPTVARFSPSGFQCASGDVTGEVQVWETSNLDRARSKYQALNGRINDLAWDGDSKRLIVVGEGRGRFGHCFTADSGNTVGEVKGHTGPVYCVAVKNQRPIRATTAGNDSCMVLYEGLPFKYSKSLRYHQRNIYDVEFSPDGSLLISVGADSNIILYDGMSGMFRSQIRSTECHLGSIFGVSWAEDSRQFTTCGADQSVKLWDAETGKIVQSWHFGDDEDMDDKCQQAVGVVWPHNRSDGLIAVLNLAGDLTYLHEGCQAPSRIIQGHQKSITSMSVLPLDSSSLPSARTYFTGDHTGRVCMWNTDLESVFRIPGLRSRSPIAGLLSTSTDTISTIAWDDTLRKISLSGTADWRFEDDMYCIEEQPIAIAAASQCIIVASLSKILIFDSKRHSLLSEKILRSSQITALAACDGYIAVAEKSCIVQLYELCCKTGTITSAETISGMTSEISCLSFSSCTTRNSSYSEQSFLSATSVYLAIGFCTGRIKVFSSSDRFAAPLISHWYSHVGRVSSLAWNLEATCVLSGGMDNNIFIWSIGEPNERRRITAAHRDGVTGVDWLDANRIISVGSDGTIKTWQTQSNAVP